MALSKTVSTIVTNQTVAASGETTLANCTELDLDAAVQVEIEVLVTYNATATAGVTARVWMAAVSGDYGTDPGDEFAIPLTASSTVRYSFQTRASARYMKVTVANEDDAYSATGVTVKSTVQNIS